MGGKGSGRGRAPLAAAAWAAATAVAVAVSWFGLDSVLVASQQDAPAVFVAGPARTAVPVVVPGTAVGSPSRSPAGSPSAGAGHPVVPARRATAPASATPMPSVSPSARLSRYETGGGVVVLAIDAAKAALVSATPTAGYAVREWSAPGWLRVDFTDGSSVYSVYATWNGYPPRVQVVGPSR